MSFAALALTICTAFSCEVYNLDTHSTASDCLDRLEVVNVSLSEAWNSIETEDPLVGWLAEYQIFEDPMSIQTAELSCVVFTGKDS